MYWIDPFNIPHEPSCAENTSKREYLITHNIYVGPRMFEEHIHEVFYQSFIEFNDK